MAENYYAKHGFPLEINNGILTLNALSHCDTVDNFDGLSYFATYCVLGKS